MPSRRKKLNPLSSAEHMHWVKGRDGYLFQTQPLKINASPGTVWAYAKDPNHYFQNSHGAVWAYVDGPVAPQSPITLKLFKDKWIGKIIPTSNEIISIADDTNTTIGWERKLPFFGGTTERYHVLESSSDENTTMSYIALKVPGPIGFFSKVFLNGTIKKSFKELNNGIKESSENHVI
jgi:hypothetical protein